MTPVSFIVPGVVAGIIGRAEAVGSGPDDEDRRRLDRAIGKGQG